ncbi:helix-turn-helix domain-containing protein [Actinomycetota bacterium Odt1-20B]
MPPVDDGFPGDGPHQDAPQHVTRRLTLAAARSGAALIAEAAALADGWATLVDPVAGAVHSYPHTAAPAGVRAVAYPRAHPHLLIRQAAGAVLVLGPGKATPGPRAALVAQTTVDLLRVRARQADETRGAEQRLHGAVLHLLLHGQDQLATEVLGGCTATHATVYRLTGQGVHAAHHALWRAVRPHAARGAHRVLIALDGAELTVVALHDAHGDQHRTLPLVARVAERHQLTGGAADPVPLDVLATAWAEAGTARTGAAPGCLSPATGLGAHELLHVVPADRLAAWSAAVLAPLDREQRRTLEAWLRAGSAQAAAPALDVSENTVRARLRTIGAHLAADLDSATVQAQLLLALRTPAPAEGPATAARLPATPLPPDLLAPAPAERWARALLEPLDVRLRIALRCWLRQRARTAPAAAELGLHRTTLTAWLAKCAQLLDLDLSLATVRAELHLAAETLARAGDATTALPRRGGRTYRGPAQ